MLIIKKAYLLVNQNYYIAVDLILALFGFATVFVLFEKGGPGLLGEWTKVFLLFYLLSEFVTGPSHFMLNRSYGDGLSVDNVKKFFQLKMLLYAIAFLLSFLSLFLFSFYIWLFISLRLLVDMVITYLTLYFRLSHKMKPYFLINIFPRFVFLLSIFLLAELELLNLLMVQLVCFAICAVVYAVIYFNHIFAFRLLVTKSDIIECVKFLPHKTSKYVASNLDLYLVSLFASLEVLGLLSFIRKCMSPMQLLSVAVNKTMSMKQSKFYASKSSFKEVFEELRKGLLLVFLVGLFSVLLVLLYFLYKQEYGIEKLFLSLSYVVFFAGVLCSYYVLNKLFYLKNKTFYKLNTVVLLGMLVVGQVGWVGNFHLLSVSFAILFMGLTRLLVLYVFNYKKV